MKNNIEETENDIGRCHLYVETEIREMGNGS